jgi:predicted 3-demethylubiquinone-9 3-methyltransferase (glyoxalase superfamily)
MKIVTSLSFQGQCREAFDFYAKVEAKAGVIGE